MRILVFYNIVAMIKIVLINETKQTYKTAEAKQMETQVWNGSLRGLV